MRDGTAELFESLRRRGHEPLLQRATGTMRFVLENGRTNATNWTVVVDKGDLTVSHAVRKKADCTVRASKQLFDRIARGEVNAMAAMLRGAVTVEGDPELLLMFQRLLPGPPKPGGGDER
jgi:putative sterol carrier protein